MRWHVLNPPASTAFLLKDGAGEGRDLLLDMQGARASLAESLAEAGSAPERIAHLFLTHHHGDHFFPEEALALARGGARVHIGRASWAEFMEILSREPRHNAARAACEALEKSGALALLDPSGERVLGGRRVAWATFPHGNGAEEHVNLAFRVDDHLFSGDTSVPALLNARDSHADALLDLRGGSKVNVLCLNLAQFSREEVRARSDLPPRRIRNYLHNHGLLEDLLAALADPELARFFGALEAIVPHHLRRAPLWESARLVERRVLAAARRKGYTFEVIFGSRAAP